MSYEDEPYQSEFEAPVHSLVNVRFAGLNVIRTVVMDRELMEFVVPREMYLAGKSLEDEE